MKHLFLFFCITQLLIGSVHAQRAWYVNGGVGPMNYVGDLRDKRLTAVEMKYDATAGLSYQYSPHFAANFYLSYGKVSATDANNGPKWVYRNLNFKSSIFEAAFTAEADLWDIDQPDDQAFADKNPKKFTPFFFAGIGFFHFNPYTYDLAGNKTYLEPLGTEGQTTPYSLWSVSFPFGIGGRYALNNKMMLSVEVNIRKTLTDYIDDVSSYHFVDTAALLALHGQEAATLSYRADEIPNSPYQFYGQRGNPKKKDGYYSFMIKFSYQLFTRRPLFYYGY